MFSVSVSKSISVCNSTNPNEQLSADERLIITNESDALKTLLKYFSEKINNQCCDACFGENFRVDSRDFYNKQLKRFNSYSDINNEEYAKKPKRIYCINTCYFSAVQVQVKKGKISLFLQFVLKIFFIYKIAEFFRSFDLNFDKKLNYQEFYKGFTSLFLTAESKAANLYLYQ